MISKHNMAIKMVRHTHIMHKLEEPELVRCSWSRMSYSLQLVMKVHDHLLNLDMLHSHQIKRSKMLILISLFQCSVFVSKLHFCNVTILLCKTDTSIV